MDNKINTFCKRYLQKIKNDKEISETQLSYSEDYRERINFHVIECSTIPAILTFNRWNDVGIKLITLDEDDLKYLYDKYSKQLRTEMLKNIEEVKKSYGLENETEI